ncbi:MAG: hypothetical protein P1P88_09950 [Bacteroidales bacterium]|nr:hypothetical protein [Bacteroidales bacterium]
MKNNNKTFWIGLMMFFAFLIFLDGYADGKRDKHKEVKTEIEK